MAKTTIHSDYIPDNAITSTKIAENSIGAREIATNAITTLYVADGSVTTVKIADDAITSAKLDTNIDIAGTLDVTGATTLDAGLTVDTTTLVVDATNNRVGIGTSSPTADLSVGSTITSSGDVHLRTTKTAFSITPSNTDAGGILFDLGWVNGGQGPMKFGINGSVKMRIDSSGRVLAGKDSVGARSAHTLARTGAFAAEIIQQQTSAGASVLGLTYDGAAPNNTTDYFIYAIDTAGIKHLVRANGDGYFAGKVGIGTSNPQMKLHVGSGTQSTAALEGIGIANGGSAYSFYSASDGTKQYIAGIDHNITYTKAGSLSNHSHAIITNNTNAIFIDTSQNVGIGTSSPAKNLEIFGSGSESGILVKNDTNTNYRGYYISSVESDNTAYGKLHMDVNSGELNITSGYSSWGGFITFDTNGSEKMQITGDGRVRIGTSGGTGQRLSINGFTQSNTMSEANAWLVAEASGGDGIAIGTRATTPYATWIQSGYLNTLGTSNHYALALNPHGGNVGIGNVSPTSNLTIGSAQSDGLEFTYDSSNTYRNRIVNYWNSSTDTRMDFEIGPTGNVAPTAIMSVGYGGNVGIGTTSPSSMLTVNGTIESLKDDSYGSNEGGQITLRAPSASTTTAKRYSFDTFNVSGNSTLRLISEDDSNGANGVVRTALDTKGTFFFTNGLSSYAHNTYAHAAVFSRNSTPHGTVVIEDSDVSSGIGNTVLKCYLRDQDPATLANFINFSDGGGTVGSITHNDDGGGVTYNTTSDYRLKENVNYDWDGLSLLNQLKPAKFNFIRQPSKTLQGFLAHEVKDIVPSSVRGDKDHMEPTGTVTDSDGNVVYENVYEHFCKEGQTWIQTGTEPVYQELDYSRLVPLLTKAIQEQQTIIDDLKSRLDEAGL